MACGVCALEIASNDLWLMYRAGSGLALVSVVTAVLSCNGLLWAPYVPGSIAADTLMQRVTSVQQECY